MLVFINLFIKIISTMQEYKNSDLLKTDNQNYQFRPPNLMVDVTKRYDQKQIDTRWVELKMNGKLLSRSYFASCIQAGKIYLHGGYNEQKGILGDLYEAQFYDLPSEWVQIKVRSPKLKNPPCLRNHTICPYTSSLILFGGQKSMLENNNQFFKFDLRTNEWQVLKVKFQNDKRFSLALDSHITKVHNNNLYIFGGYQSEKGVYSNSLYEVSLKELSKNQIQIKEVIIKSSQKPSPRGNFSSCIIDNDMYIFGGTNSDEIFDDLWFFNLQKLQWKQVTKPLRQQNKEWPQKRKGHIMVNHIKSRSIFMFGGIKQITKEQNDIMVYLVSKSKWVRIHRSTNQLYEPSPTLKKQIENSPTIIQAKNRKTQKSVQKKSSPFKLAIKSVTVYNKSMTQIHDQSMNHLKSVKTEYGGFMQSSNGDSPNTLKKHMSVVQQKKMRQFMNRKKKLLHQVNKNAGTVQKRPHSPTSETIIYSIDSIGEQKKYPQNFQDQLPKVIFDEQKGALIGKKPCARDGHGGLAYEDSIIIFGGDRHMMSFNDVYLFKMDKAIQNIHLYE